MSKTSRYVLLAVGIVLFLVLAPVIVLYVTGVKYDLANGQFVHTGLIAVRSDPSSVDVVLNGQTVRHSDGDIKFLNPGEYSVSLQKPGYQSWSKRFYIQADQVTWANPAPNRLFLFKQDSQANQVAKNVTAMQLAHGNLLYLSSLELTVIPTDNLTSSEHYNLPKPASAFVVSPDENNFILQNVDSASQATSTAYFFSTKSKQLVDVSKLFSAPFKLQFSDANSLYALSNYTIYAVDVSSATTTPLVSNVSSFTILGGNIYYLTQTKNHNSLMSQSLSGGQPQLLLGDLPAFASSQIFVNFQKQVLLLLDDTLYRVSAELVGITSGVSNTQFDGSNLLVLHNGELDYYNYAGQSLNFITRTSQSLSDFIIRSDLGYTFLFKDKTLGALELDLRDHQNEYDFYQASAAQSFFVSDDGKNLFILDNGTILMQNIR